MGETALNFGPDWLRALSHGSTNPSSQPSSTGIPVPKYSLADYRYGREEMLALIPKDQKPPDCLKEFPHLSREKFQIPLALTPMMEEEQRIWARSVNSDAVLRASGKSGTGNSMGRSGRGGSVDRGRGRGRGSYYQRGLTYEDSEDNPPSSFSRPKPIERSQSASEKDQRWDDRDRRFDRPFSGRGGVDDTVSKQDLGRGSNEYWRKFDKDDDSDWRSSLLRSTDKLGRGSWRNSSDKDRRDISDRNPPNRNGNGSVRAGHHPHQKALGSHHSWKEDSQGNLPEWSVEEASEPDIVGTFDSSGAFLETKVAENTNLDEIYASDDADEGTPKDSPEAKKINIKKPQKKLVSSHSALKQNSVKSNAKSSEETVVDTHSHENVSEPCKNVHKNSANAIVEKSTDHVIKQCAVVEQHHTVNKKKPDYIPVTLPNVPDNDVKSTKCESSVLSNTRTSDTSAPTAILEEDAFAHHKKATENMVAQWTEEEEQRVISQSTDHLPSLHEKDNKWFYQDPQGEIQGPFTSPEMLEWFSAGYFTMSLMVRRGCDEKFCQLGELIKSWGRVPFMPGNSPPPIRVTPMTTSLPTPLTQTIVPNPVATSASAQLPKQDDQLLALQQQLIQQQFMQQQLLLRQAQLQQILSQLKQQDNFTSLNSQQQQQVILQQFMAQHQIPRPNIGPLGDQPSLLESVAPLPLPLLGLPLPPMMKNDISLWNLTPGSAGTWPVNLNTSQPPGGSIWDVDITKPSQEDSELEKKRLAEEQEKLRKAEEQRLEQEREMEEKRKLEELRRKQEEERILKELQKQEEEKKRLEELQRREEEKRQEELRKLEELKRKEEELRKQEELRKIEEQKRLEELKLQEEQKRLEELKRKEEERRQEELRRLEEQRLEEKRKKEEMQKKLQMEKEKERQLELERQKELEEKLLREKEEMEIKRLAELKLKSQGPVWGIQNSQNSSQLSLADIQRLQEEKEKEEKEERLRQQLLQQQAIKQVQQAKNGLSWAKRSNDSQPAVKSLAEIQQEEAERLAQLQRSQKAPAPAPIMNSNSGVWGNSSHLNRITSAPQSWNINNVVTSGFWEDALNSTQARKQTPKTNDSAFPALANPVQPATTNSNKSKNVRAKKEEDVVTRLFGTHRKPTDEFTLWCTEAISSMPSSVDVPTFVAFLKDIESPYEVYDYVKSYLGEGKEPREFAKQFLERRSKYRNQAKQSPAEENMLWGPAPAITPSVNKLNVQTSSDCDGNSGTKGKTKKRKNRMQKLDNSMLGFTVQSNPDRLNVGEIDHVEGM